MSTFLLILITGIGLGALYFLVASGLSLIYGLMGVLNFAHGAFLTVGAFFGFWYAKQSGFMITTPNFLFLGRRKFTVCIKDISLCLTHHFKHIYRTVS